MAGRLGDDGTMDTVIYCSECGEEARYNFDSDGMEEDGDSQTAYEDFVEWAIEDFNDSHECDMGTR